jgi:glycosyltransferase involved in cell wall biosynthesis
MRLLLVNYEYPPVGGGAATATQAIAQKLVALGHQVTVFTGSFREVAPQYEEMGVTVRRIPCFRRRADRCSIFEMFTFTLVSLFMVFSLRRYSFDGVIAFFAMPSGAMAVGAHLLYDLPYVISLRGGDVPGLTPEVSWMHRFLTPLRRYILAHATAVVANSDGLRELSEAADSVATQVIPNGVDADFFRPTAADFAQDDKTPVLRILFVGRFQKQKNLPYLFEQCAHLPLDRFVLHLVGDGPLRAELHLLAEQRGIASAIVWHGWLPRPALRAIYQAADCLVNPSFYEGMPNVVLEAMACGLPVLASNIPGNDALVRPGETGYLFDPAQGNGLQHALEELLADRSLISRFGANGRARAVAQWSWERVARSYVSLFGEKGGGSF